MPDVFGAHADPILASLATNCQWHSFGHGMTKRTKNRLTTSTHLGKRRPQEWISQAEAARLRGVSRQAMSRLIAKGRFATLAIGGRVFVKRRDVLAFAPADPGRPRK